MGKRRFLYNLFSYRYNRRRWFFVVIEKGGVKVIVKDKKSRKETKSEMFGGNGEVQIEILLEPDKLKDEMRMFNRMTFPPGASLGLHDHVDNFEIYYILEGEGTAIDDGKEVPVQAGDVIYTADGATHALINSGNRPLVMLATIIFENK